MNFIPRISSWLRLQFQLQSYTQQYEIYTDGSLKKNIGSWAYVIVKNGKVIHEDSGRVPTKTTSLRMETQAAIEALQHLPNCSKPDLSHLQKSSVKIKLFSDSRVLVTRGKSQISDWQNNGWLKKNGRPIPDLDQIFLLAELTRPWQMEWMWIPAHRGIIHNERCDQLCLLARTQLEPSTAEK